MIRSEAIKNAKKQIEDARNYNEEIEISEFVMHELTRFENEFGRKQLELCNFIVSGGPQHFFECAEDAMKLAYALP